MCIIFTRNKGFTQVQQVQTVNVNSNQKEKINLNKASLEELKSLPGIGDKLAVKIIENRPYASVWDLNIIKGIKGEIIRNIVGEVECK